MTFRITRLEEPRGTVLKIDGWLDADGLPDLERELGRTPVGPSLTLDLMGLRQADDAALSVLRRLAADGVRLINCPPYLALRLAAPVEPGRHGGS